MPTNRRRIPRSRVGVQVVLTGAQEWELLLGPSRSGLREGESQSAFNDEAERRSA
jgi:hypothetical protein